MSSFSPFSTILNQNKLTGPNYVDWKRNMDIVLTAEGHKYVLAEACPDVPAEDASEDDKQRFNRWRKSDEMAKCYILASVANVIQHQLQEIDHASAMMTILREMFGEQSRAAKADTMRSLLSTKMAEGTPVREHCLSMIAMLNTLEVLGAEIDGESQVDMILQSLPSSFNQFRLNVSMSKKDYTLAELMNELIAAESILKNKTSAFIAHASNPKPKGKWKKKQFKQASNTVANKPKPAGKGTKANQWKKNCFYCDQPGH
jgi:hypothetical protein